MAALPQLVSEPPARRPGRRRAEDRSESSARPRPRARRGRPKHVVLIVDDLKDARDIYAAYFESRGFGALTAADEEEAIARAISARPNVIIMDLAMPRLDGVDAIQRLKRDRRTRAIAVILLTAYADRAIAAGAVEAGAAAFLTKPCLPEDLEATVRRLLGDRAARS